MAVGRLLALDRNLAFAVSRGLSKRQAIHPIRQLRGKRHLATTVSLSSSTETTTLPNGFTIATDFSPYAQTATVGVWIDSGSRAETAKTNGTAHFLEHLTFKGTASRSQQQLELQIENLGAHLNAYTSREQTVYYAKALNQDVGQCVEIISDILQNSTLSPAAVDRERDVIVREQQEVDKQLEEVVFDHLHAVAFQGQALGRTILGPTENIMSINRGDLTSYINENYTAERMVLVGAGGVAHEQLVSMAEKHFGKVPSSPSPQSLGTPRSPTPRFIGSEVRLRDDTMPMAHIALAVEGVGWQHEDYWVMQVMQAIIGNWDRALGSAANLGSRLASFVSSNDLANSFMSFSTSYSDTGLWGIYLVSENLVQLDDLVHFTLKEWARLSLSVTAVEVERAKAQLRASLLLSLDNTTAVAEDVGRQIITSGRRMSPQEVERTLAKVTEADVRRVALERLWDQDLAITAIGPIEGLLDYNRIRTDMSMNRW